MPTGKDVVIESETRYRWYKENTANDYYGYFDESKISSIDMNNYIYTTEIEVYEEPQNIPYREIEAFPYTLTYDKSTSSQLLVNNFTIRDAIEISEISVYDKANLEFISYTLDGRSVFDGDATKIDDDYMSADCLTVHSDTYLLLILDKEYNITDLEIHIYISDNNRENNSFYVSFLKDYKYKIQTKKHVIRINRPNCYANHCKMIVENDNTWISESSFDVTKYVYKDKLFMYLKNEREYLDGYYVFVNDYIKDEIDYKTYYRYKENSVASNTTSNKKDLNKNNNTINSNKTNEVKVLDVSLSEEEKVHLIDVSKIENTKLPLNKTIIYVVLSLFLTFILIIGRNIYKKNKNSRTN